MLIAAVSPIIVFLLKAALFSVSLFLILVVLVQRGKGGGLTGALGGAGGQSAFGTKAGDVFTKFTVGLAITWILLCLITIQLCSKPTRPKPKSAGIGAVEVEGETGDGIGATGIGATGIGEAGDGEAGDGEAGDGEAGDGEAGDGETGDGETGDGEAGDGEAGDGETGDGETGDGETGDGEAGDGETE